MRVRYITIKQGEIIITIKKHKECSLEVLETVWFILSRKDGEGENSMNLLNEIVYLLNLEGSCLTFLLIWLLAMMAFSLMLYLTYIPLSTVL